MVSPDFKRQMAKLYDYVAQQPTRFVDPSGLEKCALKHAKCPGGRWHSLPFSGHAVEAVAVVGYYGEERRFTCERRAEWGERIFYCGGKEVCREKLYKRAYALVDVDCFAFGLALTADVGIPLVATLKGYDTAQAIHDDWALSLSFEFNAVIGFDYDTSGTWTASVGVGLSIAEVLAGSVEVEYAGYCDLRRDWTCRVKLQGYPRDKVTSRDIRTAYQRPRL